MSAMMKVAGHDADGRSGLEAMVGDSLDDIRSARLRIVPPILLGVIMMFDSWDSIAIAYTLPVITSKWKLSPVEMGSLISSGYAGQFVGAILLGALAERYGRIRVFIASITVMSALAVACALSGGYSDLMALRFAQGVLIGGALPVSITYINELAPTSIRGRYFAWFQAICMSGYIVASLASTVVVPHLGWRWMFGLGALPMLALPFVPILLPESPRWLARAGRDVQARAAVIKLGGKMREWVSTEPGNNAGARAPSIPSTALFRSPHGVRTAVVLLLWFLTSFAGIGLLTWAPSIYVRVFHVPIATTLRFAATTNVMLLLVAPTVALLIDRVGRRPIAIVGTALASIALLTLAADPPSGILRIVGWVICGQVGVYAGSIIMWPYTAESYPTQMRATALGLSSSMARAAAMLTPVVVGAVLEYGGPIQLVFGVFGVCTLSALTLWLVATRETANVKLESV